MNLDVDPNSKQLLSAPPGPVKLTWYQISSELNHLWVTKMKPLSFFAAKLIMWLVIALIVLTTNILIIGFQFENISPKLVPVVTVIMIGSEIIIYKFVSHVLKTYWKYRKQYHE